MSIEDNGDESHYFAQRYVAGRSLLFYLPLFNTMNDTLTAPPPRVACHATSNAR
jgi:hypothetical protein